MIDFSPGCIQPKLIFLRFIPEFSPDENGAVFINNTLAALLVAEILARDGCFASIWYGAGFSPSTSLAMIDGQPNEVNIL